MPVFELESGSNEPRRLRKKGPEKDLTNLLFACPSLLLHPSAAKRRQILWFWKAPKSPGDLWGFDSKGHLIIVEVKRQLGVTELKKATKQIRKAARAEIDTAKIQKEWARLHSRGAVTGTAYYHDEFAKRMKHGFHPKPRQLHVYIVAAHYTRQAARLALKQDTTIVLMFELAVNGRRLVFAERLTG